MLAPFFQNSKRSLRQSSRRNFKNLWFERMMALIALANLVLVVFDLRCIPWRDVYLRQLPQFTNWYGTQLK
ncbi:MAG: hypothetical protein HC772_20060, partial [Leptolyngbyaceae cyanobacterium CRU_2_3]|nr:hypothetical protein [Leptolyngbyaceae cyanobacterium CRU_2_3]